ncbi:hypothetical protein K466DRAFT_45750 [Polyporus arcularius HHB13444]|uniref:Uncharacterized protein n=1 Tax=Polyporus arcularius HHB13444 TaxID=1314778 RepID=A0A5C3PIW6_9APHY|nr:hypothetical protein K466DRAFT_45750 [Polyporus arcularius HHB13444]
MLKNKRLTRLDCSALQYYVAGPVQRSAQGVLGTAQLPHGTYDSSDRGLPRRAQRCWRRRRYLLTQLTLLKTAAVGYSWFLHQSWSSAQSTNEVSATKKVLAPSPPGARERITTPNSRRWTVGWLHRGKPIPSHTDPSFLLEQLQILDRYQLRTDISRGVPARRVQCHRS